MRSTFLFAALAAAVPATAIAQPSVPAAPVQGVRLEIVGVGEVARTPDLVTISAGVETRAPQAQAALRDNAARMERVRAALTRLGIPARDIQTGIISLNQLGREPFEPAAARPAQEFTALNQLTIRFRDVAAAGRIIDALVAEGANNVQGPMFGVSEEAAALDEARTRALAAARARADLYARALGTRVRRIVAISESPSIGLMGTADMSMRGGPAAAETRIEPGQQLVTVSLNVVFELEQPGG